MKRFYQTEWQNIQFSDFATLSETKLAGPEFYNAFYNEVFQRYSGYDKLDELWRQNKKELADWIADQLVPGVSKSVLSVGCGLGYMERCLHRDHGHNFQLNVSDFASDALTWLRLELPTNQIHLFGDIDKNLYDLILLSAVDYAVPTKEMIDLLASLQKNLKQGGRCLMISASYLELSLFHKVKFTVFNIVKHILKPFGFYKLKGGQFLGWLRTRNDYRELMKTAGYFQIEDGFIETPNQRTYFISGKTYF